MKINWRVRLKNKAWLMSMAAVMITFIYQVLALCNILPPINESMTAQVVAMGINLLVALGVVVDPTTQGVNDSSQAMQYKEPGGIEHGEMNNKC